MHKQNDFYELESQIYDLNYSNGKLLRSCSIIFLIPENSDGSEEYYIYYDDEISKDPDYPDRVNVGEGYYYYAPIPVVPFESSFYKIVQDGNLIYVISKEGLFLGTSTSHQVIYLKDNTKTITNPKDIESLAAFDYFYYYGTDTLGEFCSTIQKLLSNQIIIDGNLMVEVGIESTTKKDDVLTTATYKYYYCPTEHKRMHVHVVHDILKDHKVVDAPISSDSCGNIAGLQVGVMKSPSIDELNFGKMYPYMHVYEEDGIIQEYKLDLDPEYSEKGTIILQSKDDVDLGERAWASYDFGSEGLGHAIIFGSNNVIKSGTDERDGIQIFSYEASSPGVLGLESDLQSYYFHRNFYEEGTKRDLDVPKDLKIEFEADYFSTKTGGYKEIDEEAKIFQSLVKIKPKSEKKVEGREEKKGNCSLTAYVHLTFSSPLGALPSLVTGKNFPYITGELYKADEQILSDIAGRLPINPIPSFSNTTFIQKIKLALGIIDFKNFSIFKKVRFTNIEPGTYLVKIYKENSVFSSNRKFIGYSIVEVKENSKTHIFCKPQGSLKIHIVNQHKEPVSDVEAQLVLDDIIISSNTSLIDGTSILKVPCSLNQKYLLRLFQKGLLIHEQEVKIAYFNSIKPKNIQVEIKLFDLQIKILDKWNLKPSFKLNPILKSVENVESENLIFEKTNDNEFLFKDLTPGDYQLDVSYKSFNLLEIIKVDSFNEEKVYSFPAEYKVDFNVYNTRGLRLDKSKIWLSRNNKDVTIDLNSKPEELFLPPGTYDLEIYSNEDLVGKRKINVIDENSFNLITNIDSDFPLIFVLIIFSIFGIIGVLTFRKRNYVLFLKIVTIALALVSIIMPWWSINGSSNILKTSTNLYIYPTELATLTETSDVIAGELGASNLPEIITSLMTVFTLLIISICLLIILNIIFEKYIKKKLSLITLIASSFISISCISVFYIGLSTLSKMGVGSFFGSGILDIKIPGENTNIATECTWGPTFGFYLLLISALVLLVLIIFKIRKNFLEYKKYGKKLLSKNNVIFFFKKIMPFIGIFLLIYLIIDIGVSDIADTFLKISPAFVVFAAILTIPRVLLRNYGWQILFKKQNIKISYVSSLKILLMGYFYASVTPGYLGQLIRIPYLKDKTNEPTGKLFINNLIETILHNTSLFIMVVIGAFFISKHLPEILPIALGFLIANLIIYWFFISKKRGEGTFNLFIKYLTPNKFRPYLKKFIDTFYKDFPSIKSLIKPFLITMPTWFIIYTQIYIIGLSLGISSYIPYLDFIMLYSIANLIAYLPITAAGLGTREAALIVMFSFYGVAPEVTIVVSIAGHLVTDVLTGFYGLLIATFEARNNKKSLSDVNKILNEK